jgi:DNA helicase-2/ATP-dependent DNA helicase PcrA
MGDILSGLNAQQREAVTTTEGYVRVIAGAGSGKTRALSHRFAYLVQEVGILPSAILCVTFTNKSANEMRARIRGLTGDNDTGTISTFHSFCVTVLQEDSHAVQYPRSFLVLDNSDIDKMLAIVYEERGLTLRHKTFAQARDMIEICKLQKEPDYYEHMIAMPIDRLREMYMDAAETDDIIFRGYLYQQKKCFGLDYNDLIKYTLHIFNIDGEIKAKWQRRLEYVMIDEYQDIDQLQYDLMKALTAYHKNLYIVGDPDQTIYTWRGASVKFIMDFGSEFPDVRTVMMTANYRSTPQIIAVANSLILANHHRVRKELEPVNPEGAPVVYHHAKTTEDEARWIAARIRELQGGGVHLGDITVLYRAHYVSRALEEVFMKEELPYTIYSGVQFFSRMEVKDALSYLRLIAFKDDLSFMRVVNVPKRNLGERRMRFLQGFAAQNNCSLYAALERTVDDEIFSRTGAKKLLSLIGRFSAGYADMPVSELLSAVMDASGFEEMLRTEGSQERLDNLAELKQAIHEYEVSCGEESTLESYLSHIALMTNADTLSGKNSVKMMTVHAAKGLEFPHVFLCGMSEGVFPSKKTGTLEGMEEERRLAFVAVTRAKKTLCLSDAEGRTPGGTYRVPSRFIFDIDKKLLQYTGELPDSLVREAEWRIRGSEAELAQDAAGPRFAVGMRVTHTIMGAGQVIGVDEEKGVYTIQFDGIMTPRNISFKAKLEAEGG